jgi:two-component system chemotaxis response regulator CheB
MLVSNRRTLAPVSMSKPVRVIGIGASAGGVDVLLKLVSALPGDLPHAICIALHVPPTGKSMLAAILDRRSELRVETAQGGERLRAGSVYVAPPDRHLLIGDGGVTVGRGPKENGVRPAVDPMLRSLAGAYGPAAVAVIVSGALGDGADGARAVADAGGTVIVQDPDDALVASMPERAIEAVGTPDAVLTAVEIGRAIGDLGDKRVEMRDHVPIPPPEDMIEESRNRPAGPATGFTCPECHGALWEVGAGDMLRYRCRIGHAYSEDALFVEQGSAVEAALWSALEVLEERAELLRKMAARRADLHPRMRTRFEAGARDAQERADLIRRALATGGDRPDAFQPADAEEAAEGGR